MSRRGLFVPRLHEKNVRRLYRQSNRFAMPVSKLLNLIVSTGLEQLEEVNDPDEWGEYTLVRPEEDEKELPIRPINFPFPEFQAARRVKHLTLAVVGYPLVILTGMSADAGFPRRRHS
jgi:hypothetical protein